jgi:hypothetical protein
LDRLYTSVEDALEEAGMEAAPEDQIKLIQVLLDQDMPARWADDAARRVEALVDEDASPEEHALVDAVLETLRDYEPQGVDELPGLTPGGQFSARGEE